MAPVFPYCGALRDFQGDSREIVVYAIGMAEETRDKVPHIAPWGSKEELPDPFQRALIQQLQWLNANLWEVRTNLAIISNKMDDLRPKEGQR